MKHNPLGQTDILVSEMALGTMTWGEQNTAEEAFEQIDYALDFGVNLLDVAEMYPVPPKPETQGRTEVIIGEWFAKHGRRHDVILATKIAGPSQGGSHIRGGKTRFNAATIAEALDGSLKRLQTDYIDLYQLHWPERQTNFFGKLGYEVPQQESDQLTPFLETIEALDAEVKRGRIRAWGLSNETPWGLSHYVMEARANQLTPPVSIQNPYNLLNRSFEVGLAEMAIKDQVGLLAYSPLGFGILSGKYQRGARPAGARLTRFSRFDRYFKPQVDGAVNRYIQIAKQHDLDPAQMALAFIQKQPFLTSNIIGATTMAQLKANLQATTLELDDAVMQAIEQVHQDQPNPAP